MKQHLGSMALGRRGEPVAYWRKALIAVLDQDPPVQSQSYTVLGTTYNVRVLYIAVRQINDEEATKTISRIFIGDGITATSGTSALNNTWYYLYYNRTYGVGSEYESASTSVLNYAYYTPIEFSSFSYTASLETAVGTNQQLDVLIQYEVLTLE